MSSLLDSLRNFGNSNAVANAVNVPQGYSSLRQFGSDQSPSLYNLAQAEKAKQLLGAAQQQYPYLNQHNFDVTMKPQVTRMLGHAETFPIGETGSPDWPAPVGSDNNRNRVEIYDPKFSSSDLAAEGLHVDQYANETRAALLPTLTAEQIKTLKHNAGDYAMSIAAKQSEQKAMENTVDSALRGHVFNQDQNLVNKDMGYSSSQLKILDALKSYAVTGTKSR